MTQHSAFAFSSPAARLTRRAFVSGTVGTAGALLLAACSGGGSTSAPTVTKGPVKLDAAKLSVSWWGADDRTQKTLAALKLYTQKHPDITFQSSYGGIVGYQDKMVTQFSGGNGPDFMQVSDRLPFIANNQLLNLDPYIKAGRLNLTGANEATLNAQRVDGKLYTLPWGLASNCFYYNKALFQDAGVPEPKNGWTWDDYVDTIKALTAGSSGVFGSEDIWAPAGTMSWQPFQLFLLSRNIQPYKSGGKEFNFTSDILTEWLDFWQGLRKDGYLPPAAQTAEENAIQTSPFVKRKTALYPINSSIATSLQGLMKDELGVVTMPSGSTSSQNLSGDRFGGYVNTSIIVGVNAATKHPDDVIDVINFLLTDPEANKTTLMARGVPLTEAAATLVTPLVSPIERSMADVISYVQKNAVDDVQAFPDTDGQIGTLMQNTQQAVAYGKQSIKDAASSFFTQGKTLLASAS